MALNAFGTLLQKGNAPTSPETFATIAEVRDISGPSLELGTEDVTSHSSTSGWRQHVTTLFGAGEVTFEIMFDPDEGTHDVTTGLLDDMEDKTLRNFKLVWPDATDTEWAFAAYVTGFEPSAPVEGALTASVTLQISGVPTLA